MKSKIVHIVFAVLFLASAVVQFNDPDPYFWVAMYGTVALIAVLALFNWYNHWVVLFVLAVAAYELFKLFPAFREWIDTGMPSITGSMKAESPHVELVREFLGLLLCIIVLMYYYTIARKRAITRMRSKPGS